MRLYSESFDYSNDRDLEEFDEAVSLLVSVFERLHRRGLSVDDLESACEKALQEFDLDEAVVKGREIDLTTKPTTIAYGLNQPENHDKLDEILTNAMYKIIPFNVAKRQIQELIQSLENVSQKEKDEVIGIVSKSFSPEHLTSVMATYYGGEVTDEKARDITRKRGYYRRW